MKKYLNYFKIIIGHTSISNVFCMALLMLVFLSCQDDDIVDERTPTIQINGIVKDEINEVPKGDDAFSVNIIIADNVGLLNYKVQVDSASVNVYSAETTDLKYKLQHETIVLDNLASNYLYDIKFIVQDVNLNSESFQFQLRISDFIKYDYLGLVGDATLAGWNPGASEGMIKDASDEAIFTYAGPLSSSGEGAVKIATFTGDWCDGDWLYAPQPNQNIEEESNFVINNCGGPDNKWQITEATAGDYLVTVNLRDESIKFERQ
ncbi:MAG: SusF/SusE family outer membrane protein [Leeuwenhoekiella sp.]